MTLNITVAASRCIYQSADYRLVDLTTGQLTDFDVQKIVLTNNFAWSATICFAGIGRTHRLDVGRWLAERVAALQPDDPFERLIAELETADEWLVDIPPPHNRHSFSVGAFLGSRPIVALVSNFEALNAPPLLTARPRLSVSTLKPVISTTLVCGDTRALTRTERRQLSRLASRDPNPAAMYKALASANRSASERSTLISPSCFTTHIRFTGEGGGAVHGLGSRPLVPDFAFPAEARETIGRLLDQQFGPGRAQLRQFASMRSQATEEYHKLQLRVKPNDPDVHSNYGAFLKDKIGDNAGATRAYEKALRLDPGHVNALGNLANVKWEEGDIAAAEILYRKALQRKPPSENVAFNFARFLELAKGDGPAAFEVLRSGMASNPDSGRLHLLLGEVSLSHGLASEAVESLRRAREMGAEQARVESALACALHVLGADLGECLAAYRVAVALNPENAALKLNLAQLLFLRHEDAEATPLLKEALRLGLDDDALLEAKFYQLAHTAAEPEPLLRELKECVTRGARLRWNLSPNIDRVRRENRHKSELLEAVRTAMLGEQAPAALDQVLARWSSV